ncbi:MAG: SAM-dependent methyltransferase [Saprospiraceae bacterium]|jgi:SAM-dependent methyltransferase
MNTKTSNFNIAYDSYYQSIGKAAKNGDAILEIGGGAHPSIKNRSMFVYSAIDPDEEELAKAPEDIAKRNGTVQSLLEEKEYDLIISKMVLEHVDNPDSFHKAVLGLLKPGGVAIHFFACRHSLPAIVNRLFPESLGDAILGMLKNRDLDDSPKYEAYYRRTLGHTKSQIDYFQDLGYEIESYSSFVGHKYLSSIPLLGAIERGYTNLLTRIEAKNLATVALVVLKKK